MVILISCNNVEGYAPELLFIGSRHLQRLIVGQPSG